MAAVRVNASQINMNNPAVASRNPGLKSAASQTAKPPPKSEPVYRQTRQTGGHEQARRGPSPRTQRAAARTVRVVQQVRTHPAVRRTTGGIGTVLVMLTGAGIVFAIVRNPALLTAPIAFLTTIIGKMGGAFRGAPGDTRPHPGASPLGGQLGVAH